MIEPMTIDEATKLAASASVRIGDASVFANRLPAPLDATACERLADLVGCIVDANASLAALSAMVSAGDDEPDTVAFGAEQLTADLTAIDEARDALDEAVASDDRVPDAVFDLTYAAAVFRDAERKLDALTDKAAGDFYYATFVPARKRFFDAAVSFSQTAMDEACKKSLRDT